MAVTKPTPKDVGTYEAKLVGPFTQRQVVCLGIGAVPAILISSLLYGIGVDGYAIAALCVILMVPAGFLAFGSKLTYGMKPEDFLIEYYAYHVKSSKVRFYETDTMDDKMDIVIQKRKKKEEKALEAELGPVKKSKEKAEKAAPVTKVRFSDPRFTPHGHVEQKKSKKKTQYRSFT